MNKNFIQSVKSTENSSLRTIAVIGAGCMGRGIAEIALISNKRVIIYNRDNTSQREALLIG